MKKILFLLLSAFTFSCLLSCEKDSKNGNNDKREFVVAFAEQSIGYSSIEKDTVVQILFSHAALAEGKVHIQIMPNNAKYGIDFSTRPVSNGTSLELNFKKGDSGVDFYFVNEIFPFDRTDKTVQFKIDKVTYAYQDPIIRGYDIMSISFDAALGGVISPLIGGPTEPNQVYVDLGGKATYSVRRDTWDLAFYNGDENRVKLNGSLYMAASKLKSNDIDLVKEADVRFLKDSVAVGTFEPRNIDYIDFPSGSLEQTAIAEISEIDQDNMVYLVNLGGKIGSDKNIAPGSVNVSEGSRGWKKIRILKNKEGYTLQYADLNSSTHETVFIAKNTAYNFQFFSFDTNKLVLVEPTKASWDLNFTVFTNTVEENGSPRGSYGFSDFAVNNRYGDVMVYEEMMEVGNKDYYKNFGKKDVIKAKLSLDLRTFGGNWRDVAAKRIVFNDRFYVVQTNKGYFYKIRMLGFTNIKGERGYPRFEYSLLQ